MRRAFATSRLIDVRDWTIRRSLDDLGTAAGLPQAHTGTGTLARIEQLIDEIDPDSVRHIALILAERPARTGAAFARRYPRAQVVVLDARPRQSKDRGPARRRVTINRTPTLDAMHEALSAAPPLQVLIENGTGEKLLKTASLRHLLFHLADGGIYVVDGLQTLADDRLQRGRGLDVWQALSRILRVKVNPAVVEREELNRDELACADAVASVTHEGQLIVVRKAGDHVLKLRDQPAEGVLSRRHGRRWGRSLDTRDPVNVPVIGTVHTNAFEESFRTEMHVPRMHLREYRDVVCAPRQLVVQDDVILPISFHHGLRGRLLQESPLVRLTGSHFANLDRSLAAAEPLPGVYYHLDSEFPGHFGHLVTEDIAKIWGWEKAKSIHPELKILVSTETPGAGPPLFYLALLQAWGIDPADIVCIDRPVRIGLLVGASQMFYNGQYVHPELKQVWARLREALRTPSSTRQVTPRRIFVARGQEGPRPCRNATAVENLFTNHGFTVVRPELLSIREQVDLFAEADDIGGFAGSGMFNAIYSTHPGRRFVIGSDEYLARNEWTIAAVNGDEYHHFFGEAEIRRRDGVVGLEAFHSGFTFDLDRDGAALEALLRE